MESVQDKLKTLKKMVEMEDDIAIIFGYFFDHLGEDQKFIDASKKAKCPFLKEILKVVGEQVFYEKVKITNLMLMKYPKTRFYHGSCFIQGRMTAVFFFEDANLGMACIHVATPSPHQIHYTRFRGTIIDGNKFVHLPQGEKKVIH